MMSKGGKVKSPAYFCNTLTQVLNTKKYNCSIDSSGVFFQLSAYRDSGFGSANYSPDSLLDAYESMVQNRLDHTIENTENAESSIRDTDIAQEMSAQYSNNNILRQTGRAVSLGSLSSQKTEDFEKKRANLRGNIQSLYNWYDMDIACDIERFPKGNSIVLNDGIEFYSPVISNSHNNIFTATKGFGGGGGTYKGICIDIRGERFAYGIRVDGKIVPGCKASKWLIKAENNKKDIEDCNEEKNKFDTRYKNITSMLNQTHAQSR